MNEEQCKRRGRKHDKQNSSKCMQQIEALFATPLAPEGDSDRVLRLENLLVPTVLLHASNHNAEALLTRLRDSNIMRVSTRCKTCA